jgi:hypothetical protein
MKNAWNSSIIFFLPSPRKEGVFMPNINRIGKSPFLSDLLQIYSCDGHACINVCRIIPQQTKR